MHEGGVSHVLQAMHYWGSAVLILHSLLHLGASVWMGRFRAPNALGFYAALLMVATAIGFQISGNILPFDKHGIQTAGVEAGISARAPIVGATVSQIMQGGPALTDHTPALWYIAHRFLLPLLALVALGLGITAWRRQSAKFNPLSLVPLGAVILLGLFVKSPFGSAASPLDFSSYDARVSWYVWPLHGTMRMLDGVHSGWGWLGAMALPGAFALFLVALPFLKRVPLGAARGVLGGFALILAVGALGFAGGFADLTGTRDPVAAVSNVKPGEKVAPIDKALAERGRATFNKLACVGCHGQDGAKSQGGPVLTNEWQKHSDADFYFRYIKNPTSVQKDSTMPAYPDTSQADLAAIAEFLRSPK